MPCALVHFQWLWIIKKNLQPLLQHPIQLLCLWKVIFLKKPCTLWVLVSVVPHYQLPNLLRMAQGCCTQQPNNLLSEVGFCPSAQQFWWNRQNKIIKKNLLHIWVGPTALEGSRENLQGATLSDYEQHSPCRACSQLQPVHQQSTKYLTGLGDCSISWAAWVLWDVGWGAQGHRTCLPSRAQRSSTAPLLSAESLSPKAGSCHSPCHNLQTIIPQPTQ